MTDDRQLPSFCKTCLRYKLWEGFRWRQITRRGTLHLFAYRKTLCGRKVYGL